MELIREHGFEGTRVEDITEAADVAVGTFFNYFESKEAVLADFHREGVLLTIEHARSLESGGAQDRFLAQMAWSARRAALSEARLSRVLIGQLLSKPSLLLGNRELMGELFLIYDGWIEEGKRQGEIRADVETRTAVMTMQELWTHSLIRWAGAPDEIDLQSRMEARVRLVFGGLRA